MLPYDRMKVRERERQTDRQEHAKTRRYRRRYRPTDVPTKPATLNKPLYRHMKYAYITFTTAYSNRKLIP